MKRKLNGHNPFALSCVLLLFSCVSGPTTLAATHILNHLYTSHLAPSDNYIEVMGAGSLSSAQAGNGALGVSSNEIYTLKQTNHNTWNSGGGQFGLGYAHFFANARRYSPHLQWLPMIEPQLNVYFNNYQNNGNVYLYSNPAFNQLNYNMPIYSTRLMLDAALTIASKRQYSTYVIAGIGNAWNRISYSDCDNNGGPNNILGLKLNNNRTMRFVWEAGVGVGYAINDIFRLSFEYLYTDYGKLKTSGIGSIGTITSSISAASIDFHTQALLLALHMTL